MARKQTKQQSEKVIPDDVGVSPTTAAKKRRRVIYIVAIVAIIGCGWAVWRHLWPRHAFMYAGTLQTTKVVLTSRVASDIDTILVEEGDMVSRGDALMHLTCDTYKILARQIDNDFNRATELSARGHMSAAELDVLTRNKQDNDLKLQWCEITSPIDGMVITKFREIGESVAPGTTLISVANPYDIWAYFYVPYNMLYQLRVGQNIVGILPEAPTRTFPGRIIKISEQAEFTPKNVQTRAERTRLVYGVKVRFDNADMALKSGMTIESNLIDE
ncbi:HlyD family efflux transporter periplasmic adaptor subunit [bacterium]|nr:HlyD family efflux transporter periplasmic adaptor subunit [bacterium]